MKSMKRILAILTVLAMVVTSVPNAFWTTAHAATDSGSTGTQVADDTTLDNWKVYFGNDDNNFNTQYAGHVWTDKSVTTDASKFDYATELADSNDKIAMNDDQNNFLVSLSAMASSKSITGQDNKPTDTMIVLDMSSSMYKNSTERDPGPVTEMIKSVNSTIKQLQELNVNNRVGVTIYYGGPDLNQATKDSYQVWLPLDRYKHKDNKFLEAKTSGGKLSSAGVNSNVTTESGTAVKANTRATTETAGTYMQQGILSALNEFMDADTKVPDNAAVNAGETRTPVMVLMSDGKPTAATNQYTRLDSAAIMGSNRENIRSANETDFLTQLTASYAKEMMDAHYKEETPLFYTLSFGNGFSYTVMDPSGTLEKKNTEHESSPATVSGYWNKLIANNSITLSYKVSKGQWNADTTSKSCTVSRTTVDGKTFPSSASQQYYVNKAFEAASSDDLADAFANIFTDISLQTHTYPTLVEGDESLDGYVSFVDKIGEYMNVTDVKGVLLGEHWYSGKEFAKKLSELGDVSNPTPLGDELVWSIQQRLGLPDSVTVRTLLNLAYQHGQLAYGNDGNYSNYVGWYSDAQGNYLGFWQEGVTTAPGNATHTNKSYVYLGETDDSHGVADSDMMYTTVRVRHEIKTGIESVSFAVPAALIPTVEYDVEYDENDNLKSVTKGGAQHPIRLVYEVALDDSVSEYTINDAVNSDYIAHNTDTAGYVNFYTNQYEGDGSVGYGKVNTYSYFKPSHQNENYYYQENEPVYINQTGTVYKGENEPDSNGVFYREITIYSNNNGTIKAENIYRQLSSAALQTAVPKADGTWYIPKGNVHVNMDDYTITKDENKTETLENANLPYVDVNGHSVNDTNHRFVIGDTLGNNGKVRIKPATGIKLSKAVTGVDSSVDLTKETFEFTVTADANVNGSCDAVKVAADGTETETTVDFSNGKAEVSLKHGESLYIIGLAAGMKFTVTEAEEADFVVSEVKVDGTVIPVTIASGTLDNGQIADVEFTNVPRGKGALTIAKQVEHPLGTDYQIPADKTFSINVKLEGIAVSSGDEFEVTHTGDADLKKVKVGSDKSFTLTLKHGESVEIKGVPEGTKATVTESNPGVGFTVTYKENGASGDGVIESVKKAPTVDNITVVNTYAPAPAEVKIDLSGVKTLKDEDGKTVALQDWGNLEFQFVIQKYVYEGGKWQWINTESVDTASKTAGDKVDFLPSGRVLTFDKVGVYGYQVIERNHGLTIDGIVYDATMHTFNVVVTDKDMDGKLEAEVVSSHGKNNFEFNQTTKTWTNDQINFVNNNNRGETSELIMIKKELQNESGSTNVSLSGYQFELFETDKDYKTTGKKVLTTPATDASGETYVSLAYTYGQAGTYYYKLKEKATGITGMTDSSKVYNFKVVVTENNDGNVTSEILGETTDTFGSFVSAVPGVTYELATFTNVYDPTDAEVTLNVKKTLENRTLKDGEFSFLMKQGAKEIETVQNAADGTVPFSKLTFDKVGRYEYTIEETSTSGKGVTVDETVYDVVITVTDNNGKLEAAVDVLTIPGTEMLFENDYQAPDAKVQLDGEKELTGDKSLVGGMFTFTLAECDKDGKVIQGGHTQKVTNNDGGKFTFREITYSAKGTHYYLITEEVPANTQGITYDTTKYLVKVDIGYDVVAGEYTVTKTISKIGETGTVSAVKFVNDYEAAPTTASITGIKDLQGRNLTDGQFTFELYAADADWNKGVTALQTTTNNNGCFTFDFGKDAFKQAGTYKYIIGEVNAGADGYTYDAKEVGVIIEVTDDLTGNLHATTSYVDLSRTADGKVTETPVTVAEFDNTYEITKDTTVKLKGTKSLAGRDMTDGEFTFVLTDVTDSQNHKEAATATNQAGEFEFELNYTAADVGNTYTYMLAEKNGGQTVDGVTYDDEEYKIVVKISDDGKGGVAADVEIRNGLLNLFEADEIKFENDYKTTDTAVRLTVDKQLTGRDLKAGEFSFRLVEVDANGKEIADTEQTVTNGTSAGAEGVYFNTIKYTAPGTHIYKISEVAGDLGGVNYDNDVIKVTVDVTDNGKGALVAKIGDQDVSGKQINVGAFQNTYDTSGAFDLTIKKNFTGRDNNEWLDADFFEFEVVILDPVTQAAEDAGDIIFPHDGDDIVNLKIEKGTPDKEVTSPDIVIKEAGTYKFRVREVTGSIAGVTYDSVPYDIVVTATDSGDGTLNVDWSAAEGKALGENNKLVFDNVYDTNRTAISGHDDLVVDKKLTGRDWIDKDAFVFKLAAADDVTKAAVEANKADKEKGIELPATTLTVTKANMAHSHFGNITFHEEGTYTFTITEQASGLKGVTDDENNIRTVVIEVVDNDAGYLVATKTSVTSTDKDGIVIPSDLTFENKYEAEPTDAVIEGSKTLTGRDLAAGEFEFQLKDKNGEILQTIDNAAANDGKTVDFSFDAIEYDAPGTYEYTVNEVVPADDDKLGGVTYDKTVYNVIVKVTDDVADAKLEATVSYETADGTADKAAFNNTYKATPVEVNFEGTKELTGRDLADGEFEFGITAVTQGAPMPANAKVSNNGEAFEFGKVEYNQAGVYEYVVCEVIPDSEQLLGGVTYDNKAVTVTVTVTDNFDGTFSTDVDYMKDTAVANGIEFKNVYKPEPIKVGINGGKQLGGRTMSDGEFFIQLKDNKENVLETVPVNDGSFAFTAIEYDKAGTHKYTVSEVQGNLPSVEYDKNVFIVEVEITDNGDGTLSSEVTKSVNGGEVNVIQFYNTYEPAPVKVDLDAVKQLTGRDWFDSDEFTFKLEAEGDTKQAVKDGVVIMPSSTEEKAVKDNKTVEFDHITITKAGTYNFVITEVAGDAHGMVYDAHNLHAIVTVTDDNTGKFSTAVTYAGSKEFVNTFTPDPVKAVLEGKKVMEGRDLAEGEFTFNIEAVTDNAPMPVVTEVTNAADGTISFGEITYTAAGNYEYLIKEKTSGLPGVTDDDTPVKAIVVVEYDSAKGIYTADVTYDKAGKDEFVFENTYKAAPVEISIDAVKTVTPSEGNSYTMEAGLFQFEIEPAESNPAADPIKEQYVTHDADGNIKIDAEYTAAGTYLYTLHEVSGEHGGVIFDTSVYHIEVTVKDDVKAGKLVTDVTVTKGGKEVDKIEFNNEYDPHHTSVEIHGHKHLEGKKLKDGDFSFAIKALTEDAPLPAETTVKNLDTGIFQFGVIVYDKVGTYEYEISEVNEGKDGIAYDKATFKVTVTVTDENGVLNANVDGVYTSEQTPVIVFNNVYKPAVTEFVIEGTKELEGRELKEGEFTFVLNDMEGNTVDEAVNDAAGNFAFDAIEFEDAGTYSYIVSEKDTNVQGITYDSKTYGVTVKVVDENAQLKVESVTYTEGGGQPADAIVFTNGYKPAPTSIQLGATKVLEGRDLTAGEFKFVLEDESGNKLYAENAADGTINFEAISYDAAGTYKYKLYEEAGDEKFVTYDETVYNITVSVKDDLGGNLKATVEGVNDGVVFKNVYEPKEPHLNIEKLQSVNGGNPTKDVLVVEEGDIITYYVKVWNDGEWTAEDVVIKDAVPEGLELIENSLAAEGGVLGEDGVTISWTIGDLEVGEEAVVTFQVEAPLADKDQLDEDGYQHWYNIASVSYSNNPDNPGEPDDPSDPDEPDKDIPSNEVEVKEPVPEEPPTDPTEPEVPMDDTSDGGTQTGDDFNAGLYGFLALAALAVAGAAVGRRRKTE